MKNEKQNEKMANGRKPQDIMDIPMVKVQLSDKENATQGIFLSIFPMSTIRQKSMRNNDPIGSHHNGKSPPGYARSPGTQGSSDSDHPTEVFNSINHIYKANNEISNKTKKTKFINNLNFKIMKKQILFLALFVVAAFANVNKSYAQCADDALHPMAGKLYHYVISTTNGGATPTYQWIVTTDPHVVATSALVTTIAPGPTTYTIANGNTADASITWSPTIIAAATSATPTPYYVVVRYTGVNSEGCAVDNVKAYQINPVSLFQIAIANVKSDGTALASGNVCTSNIVDATITPGASPTITYDYGSTNIYVKVSAKNFSTSWKMTLDAITGLNAAENGTLTWGTTIATATTPFTAGTPVTIAESTPDPTDDESIFIKFVVDHHTFEGLTAESLKFTVNGVDLVGKPDVDASCTSSATDDQVTQIILERPTVVNGTVVGSYIP